MPPKNTQAKTTQSNQAAAEQGAPGQDQEQVQEQAQEQEQEQQAAPAPVKTAQSAPRKRLSPLQILEKVKINAKAAALAIAVPMEDALVNYEQSAVGDIAAEALAKFYVSHGGRIPEAQIKAAAREFVKERVVTGYLKAPDKEGRRNILGLAMKNFFYQMGGNAIDELHDVDADALKEAADETLNTNQRLSPADKAKRVADAKKKQEEQADKDAQDGD